MRFDVHKVRSYLVRELLAAGVARDLYDDGTDIVTVDLKSGEKVIIHLIERLLSHTEVSDMLNENTAAQMHTLLILWGDMLLPPEDDLYLPEDWMHALHTLYGGKIYGYDSYGPYASVYPVYFEKQPKGLKHFIRYGEAIIAGKLHCDTVHINTPHLSGTFRVADFAGPRHQQETQKPLDMARTPLRAYFALLGLELDSSREAVRDAYRQQARRYHPDVNTAPDATERMQQINEAYRRIMGYLGEDV